ncbi:MFS transporter [Nonomuraea sp. NN258]|uniref:MFS transporter n=1 Tax=Nonomuraea antri TaxID=2730852 RepID=UPI001568A005|nr:MFS transporter [Nonomuraea antri]NRQ31914.1 MFS transporter [Nonomuraea antri]
MSVSPPGGDHGYDHGFDHDHGDRRTVAVVVAIQAAISLGYFAAMAHVVLHLRGGLGLAAGLIGLVLALRNLVQHTLSLPVGALVDVLGPVRMGILACLLRAAGFALLGTVSSLPWLVVAVVLLGAGGALFHPAAQSLLAGLAERRRARGYAAYAMTLQVAAVLGPVLGLALLNVGYWLVALTAAALWAGAAYLFTLVRHAPPARDAGGVVAGVRTAVRDRVFVWFAAVSAPAILLTDQASVVVPLGGVDAGALTVFSCVLAMVSAAVQPWCAVPGRADRPGVLRAGLWCAAGGHLLLAFGAGGGLPGLVAVAALHGLADGLLQPAVFQTVARLAPRARFGAYLGVQTFLSGLFAFAGGIAVGWSFDQGPGGATAALIVLALTGCVAAACARPLPRPAGPGAASEPEPVEGARSRVETPML